MLPIPAQENPGCRLQNYPVAPWVPKLPRGTLYQLSIVLQHFVCDRARYHMLQ